MLITIRLKVPVKKLQLRIERFEIEINGEIMTLIEQIRNEIKASRIPPIFKSDDFIKIGIEDENNNISNYDKKNRGAHNAHNTVLVSVNIENEIYYTFDEQLFD